ncbi:MAG: lysophospholipid acyltransferase family protein [Deltaproteobacteria bacterium]
MSRKEFFRKISYGMGRGAIGLCDAAARVVPLSLLYGLARFMAFFGFRLARRHRAIALDSLSRAFGQEKTPAEIRAIAEECFYSMAGTAVEFFMFMRHPERIRRFVSIEGIENLDAALKKGCGVVAVSAHFGSFPLLLSRLAQEGYGIHSVLRHMRDPGLDRFFEQKRHGMKVGSVYTQPRQECVNGSLRVLRDNEILFIQLDQNFGTAGIFVDFFGEKAATATGPIIFSLRTGAPLVPMFIRRLKGPRHHIEILPPLEIDTRREKEEAVFAIVQELTGIIEQQIRRYPHEWGWIHKRWKARPKPEK